MRQIPKIRENGAQNFNIFLLNSPFTHNYALLTLHPSLSLTQCDFNFSIAPGDQTCTKFQIFCNTQKTLFFSFLTTIHYETFRKDDR